MGGSCRSSRSPSKLLCKDRKPCLCGRAFVRLELRRYRRKALMQRAGSAIICVIREERLMSLTSIFKKLVRKAPQSDPAEPRSIVIMQRNTHCFSEDELRSAGERGWDRKFDGKEDPMYFVSADHPALTVLKAGPHIIRVTCVPRRYADNDEYALSQLPRPEQKKAWTEHHACAFLDLFNDLSTKSRRVPDKDAYASLAKLALQLGAGIAPRSSCL